MIMGFKDSQSKILIQIYNRFVSKKEKEKYQIITHSSGINFLKLEDKSLNKEILKVSKD